MGLTVFTHAKIFDGCGLKAKARDYRYLFKILRKFFAQSSHLWCILVYAIGKDGLRNTERIYFKGKYLF